VVLGPGGEPSAASLAPLARALAAAGEAVSPPPGGAVAVSVSPFPLAP